MSRIFLARHGQTEGNRDGFVLGRSDSPLTAEGMSLVEALAARLVGEPVRAIMASPLGRALATARIYAETLSAPIIVREGIAELSCGLWEGMLRAVVAGDRPKFRLSWDDRPPGGESYLDGQERVRALLGEIHSMSDAGALLVVGHAAVNRVFLKLALDILPETAMRIRCLHGLLYIVDGDGKVRRRSVTGTDEIGLSLEDEHP
jgi:broad specificity phosphatase PhoE